MQFDYAPDKTGKETKAPGCYSQFMATYLCRWPNGEFSVVSARTKSGAIELLDEWGNAEQASLTRMPDCMFDFRLDDEGHIVLADIGEATHDHIMRTCYPELEKTLQTAEWDDTGQAYSAEGCTRIRASGRVRAEAALERSATGNGSANRDWTRDSEADGRSKRRNRSNCADDRGEAFAIE